MEIEVEKSIDAQICGYVGRGVASVRVDEQGHLIFTMTDGEVLDLGPTVGGGSNTGEPVVVPLDTTLTRPGMAAEAKATGDAISQVETLAQQGVQAAQEAQTLADMAKAQAETADQQAMLAMEEAQTAAERAMSAMEEAQTATQTAAGVVANTGDLNALETDHNGNLVEAINELHQELRESTGSGGNETTTESWIWCDHVQTDTISLSTFPATTAGIRLRVYCMDAGGQTVVFPIQPPGNLGFEGGMLYGFDHLGAEVIFEDNGEDLLMTAQEDLAIYGFYYTVPDAISEGSGETWRDEELAFGAIIAGEDLSVGLDTGLTIRHLRAYRKWMFRIKNEGASTLQNFYIMAGNVADPSRATAIFRFTGSGASIFYEWWDKDRTKLAMRSVFVGDSARIADPGEPVAIDGAAHWTYHDTMSVGSIDRLTDLEGCDDDTPVWLYCPSSPSVDYIWDFRGVTQ